MGLRPHFDCHETKGRGAQLLGYSVSTTEILYCLQENLNCLSQLGYHCDNLEIKNGLSIQIHYIHLYYRNTPLRDAGWVEYIKFVQE